MDYSIYYGRFHDDSEEHAEKMASQILPVIQKYAPVDRSCSVLDIGCGYGFALRALRNAGYENLRGIEMSAQQAERCVRAGLNVVVAPETIEWLKDRPQMYDFILLLDVLEHIPVERQIDFLRAIYNSLKPDGIFLITVPNANAVLSSRWRYNDFTHHSSFTEHSLYYVLRNAGFSTTTIDGFKGLGRTSMRLWRKDARNDLRRWIVRWCWLQVFKAEIPWERIDDISFELNLTAVAIRR